MLPLFLCLVSCQWDLWGGEDAPKAGYYLIPAEALAGWIQGICHFDGSGTSCEYYIVSGTDSVDGSVTVCLNAGRNREAGKAITFHLAPSGDVLKVAVAGLQFNGLSSGEEVAFTAYDGSGDIAGHFTVPYMMADEASSVKMMDFNRFTDEAWKLIGDSLQAVCHLDEETLRNAVADYLYNGIDGETLTTFKGQVLSAEAIADLLQGYYEQETARHIGSANIEITAVTQTSDSTITIEGRIANISSIPASRQTVHEGAVGEAENRVLYGVAIGRTSSPGLQVCEACTELATVSGEHFALTINARTKPGKNYHLRPFLIPGHKVQNDTGLLPDGYICIRYGEATKFMNMNLDVEFSNFRQIGCKRGYASYEAQFTIDGKIPYLFDGMENWGLILRTKTESYAMPYYARELEWEDLLTGKNFKCMLRPIGVDVIERGADRISEFTITPFVEFKDTIINLEAKDYTFLVEGGGCPDTNHPHAIDLGLSVKWSCCNLGGFNSWDLGNNYAWGETEARKSHSVDNYKYVKDLDSDEDYWDDDANWIDIGTEISGTSYDAAHVRWGKGWRMPTVAEVEELYNECIWQWAYSGMQITGYNRHHIFLPLTLRNEKGVLEYGRYWVGTMSKEEKKNWNAYCIYFNKGRTYGCSWDYRYCGFAIRPVKE